MLHLVHNPMKFLLVSCYFKGYTEKDICTFLLNFNISRFQNPWVRKTTQPC